MKKVLEMPKTGQFVAVWVVERKGVDHIYSDTFRWVSAEELYVFDFHVDGFVSENDYGTYETFADYLASTNPITKDVTFFITD